MFDLGKFLAETGVNIDTEKREQIEYISIDLIIPDPNNFYELSGLDDLAANIELLGLQQPIRVRKHPCGDGTVIILSGHRRHAAIQKLIEEGHEELRDVPCIVEDSDENPKLTQLKLIYANASTRVISSAEQARQAEQVEKLLYELKEDGMEFPGRMRDHVAQACKVSTGKLARLKIIRSKLIPQFVRLWEADELREAVAYTLAGLTPERQKAIWIAQTKEGKQKFPCTDGWVQSIAREMDKVESVCKSTSCMVNYIGHCDHVHVRLAHAAQLSQYSGMSCRGCCCTCTWLETCKYGCEHAAREKQAIKDKKRQGNKALKDAKADEEAPKRELLRESYKRVGTLRAAAGIAPEEFIKTSTGWNMYGQAARLPELERGSKLALTDRLPGGIWPDDAQRLAATADLLGCSIDYLLCHDTPQPKPESGWYTGTPTAPGWCICRIIVDGAVRPFYERKWWGGKKWQNVTELETVTHWMPEPEE